MNQDRKAESRRVLYSIPEGARALPSSMRRLLVIGLGVVGLVLGTFGGPALADDRKAAQRLCERNLGTFIDLGSLDYSCVLPLAATPTHIREAGKLCVSQGGFLYVAAGNLAYTCVFPDGD